MKNVTLLSLVAATLLFTACGEKTKEAAGDAANKVTQAVKEDTASAVEATKQAAADAAQATKEKAAEMAAAAKAQADKIAADAAAKAAAKAAAEKKAADAAQALKDRAVAATAKSALAEPAAFAKCKVCHGADGKTKALGKSAILAGQDKAALIAAIKGYQAGTRNVAGMGMLMKGQVAGMSDADIEAVAAYLSQK